MKQDYFNEYLDTKMMLSKELKLALILQLISKEPINILLIGDPGVGKTKLLRSVNALVQGSHYFSGNWYGNISSTKEIAINHLENKSELLLIDNLGYIPFEQMPIIHEMMDLGVKVLASCNPKFGRFDPYGLIVEQINLSPSLLNRFDLIFVLKDIPDKKKDTIMVRYLLKEKAEPEIKQESFNAFAKSCQKFNPAMSQDAADAIEKYFVGMRNQKECVPISIKQVESIIKLAKSYARLNHINTITKKHARDAIILFDSCLVGICWDSRNGRIDIDRIEAECPASIRKGIRCVVNVIETLEEKMGKTVPIEDILDECQKEGVDEARVEEALERLKKAGDIFEPRNGFIQKI